MTGLASKLKTGDDVIVIAGKDKGKRGKIERVVTKTNRVVVTGVNVVKKHISQREAMRTQGEPGIAEKTMPIHVSNVMLVDPKSDKPTRLSYKIEKDGSKMRIAQKSGQVVDTLKKGTK